MSDYAAANGQEFTDATIDRWCEAYEQGEFPEGERTIGGAMGRPRFPATRQPPSRSKSPSA